MGEALDTFDVSLETRAILLLCATFGPAADEDCKPLSPREFEELVRWLQTLQMRPLDLLDTDVLDALSQEDVPVDWSRLCSLLERRAALTRSLEDWLAKGIWIVSCTEAGYPRRLAYQPYFAAPPFLYGIGNRELLSLGGLAIVGSRHADNDALAFTRSVARACSDQGIVVVSGGAHGVDGTAMETALATGGRVAGLLGGRLAKTALMAAYRDGLQNDRLVLVSPYHPDTGFHVGTAMACNKYIYAVADWGLVVSAALESGGTWAGATEAIKHGRQVFVRLEGAGAAGNGRLAEAGARPFPTPWPRLAETLSRLTDTSGSHYQTTVYDLMLPLMLDHLEQPRDLPTLAGLLEVQQSQAWIWVKRALNERRIEKVKQSKPTMYARSRQQRMPFIAEANAGYEASAGMAFVASPRGTYSTGASLLPQGSASDAKRQIES